MIMCVQNTPNLFSFMNSSVVAPRRLVLDFISSHSHRFLSLQKMSQEQGSWIPIIVIGILFLLRWIFYDQGSTAISIRKWWNYRVRALSLYIYNHTKIYKQIYILILILSLYFKHDVNCHSRKSNFVINWGIGMILNIK